MKNRAERIKLERKTVFGIALTFLLMVASTSAFELYLVEATPGTITIKADGSIEPSGLGLSTDDYVTYYFEHNILGYKIVVEKSNIIISGNRYTLQGSGSGCGFYLTSISNVTIQNTIIMDFEYGVYFNSASFSIVFGNNIEDNDDGVYLLSSSNNTISANNITNNDHYSGIWLWSSSDNIISANNMTNNAEAVRLDWSSFNTLSGNNITNNGYGICLDLSSKYNTLSGNNITNNWEGVFLRDSTNNSICENNILYNWGGGIWLSGSSYNTLRNNNVASNNKRNFVVFGGTLSHYIQDIDDSNTVNGKPVYYWVNRQDMIVPVDAGYVALINCSNITVKNLDLTNNGQGALLAYTTNSTITENNITNNDDGISLDLSSSNTISGNNITNNGYGICLDLSSSNTISGNNVANNMAGVALGTSSFNTISGNNVTDGYHGVLLFESSNNAVYGNIIANNGWEEEGCGLYLEESCNNTLFGNGIANNWAYGVYLEASSGNRIYHNDFTNAQQVYDYSWEHPTTPASINSWDDGYPSGGNYWSDYIERYPDAGERDGSGIWDIPYDVDENNKDYYPLIVHFTAPSLYAKPITYCASPSIQIGGKYFTWYRIHPSAEITIHSDYPTLSCTQPDGNGYFATYIDTSALTIDEDDLPVTLQIGPTSVMAELEEQLYSLDHSMFSYDLTVLKRDYSTFWTFKGSAGLGGGKVKYIKGDYEGELKIEYNTEGEFRLQRHFSNQVTVGATAALFALESGAISVKFGAVDLHHAFRQIRESGLMLDHDNPTDDEKAAMTLYLLTSMIGFSGEVVLFPGDEVYYSHIVGGIAELLVEDFAEHLKEYQGLGFGLSTGGKAYALEATVGPNDVNLDVAKIALGAGAEAGSFYQVRGYINSDRHMFGAYATNSPWFNSKILGSDIISTGPEDSMIAVLEIDDHFSGPAIGKFHTLNESGSFGSLDAKEVYFNFGDIRNTALYNGTVGNIDTPFRILLDAPTWCNELKSKSEDCDVIAYAKKGKDSDVYFDLDIIAGPYKLYLASGLSFKEGNDYTCCIMKRINNRNFVTKTYPYDSYVNSQTTSLTSLIDQMFDIPDMWGSIIEELGTIFDKSIETVDGIVEETVEICTDVANVVIEAGTKLYDWFSPWGHGTVLDASTDWVNLTIIVRNNSSSMGESSKSFFAANGISPSFMQTTSGTNLVVNRILDIEPFNIALSKEAVLIMNYTDEMSEGVDESDFKIYRWLEDKHVWQPLPSIVDTTSNEVRTNISRFGSFAVGYDITPPSIDFLNMSDTYAGSISFYASIVDNESGVNSSSIELLVDGRPMNFGYDIVSGVLYANISVTPGNHNISISVRDMNGNLASNNVSAESIYLGKIITINREITAENSRINLSWASEDGTYPIESYIIYCNGILLGNTMDLWYEADFEPGVYSVYPIDSQGYLGKGLSSYASAPIAIMDYYTKESELFFFDASLSYDLDGNITDYYWNFGDATSGSGITIEHKYESPGNYTADLTVIDNDNLTNTMTKMIEVGVHDVAVTKVTPSETVVSQGHSMSIDVTMENQGAFQETFYVTTCYSSSFINCATVTNLPSGEATTLTFTWNTAGIAPGDYVISAYAWPVSGETDTDDNIYIDGIVSIVPSGRGEKFGPRADKLLIKLYENAETEWDALEAGEIDITDWPLTEAYCDRFTTPPQEEDVETIFYGAEFSLFLLDINSNPNQYLGNEDDPYYPDFEGGGPYPNPVYPNPCSCVNMRRAIWHLHNKPAWLPTTIGEGLYHDIYTVVPPWYGVFHKPLPNPYPYNPATAIAELEKDECPEDGVPDFPMDDGTGHRYWDLNGNGAYDGGDEYLELIFIVRSDDVHRLSIANELIKELNEVGIRVDAKYGSVALADTWWFSAKAAHLYTGAWSPGADPDHLMIWNYNFYWHPGFCHNTGAVHDEILDDTSWNVYYADTEDEALTNCWDFQDRFAAVAVAVPWWSYDGSKAVRRRYTGGTNEASGGETPEEDPYKGKYWDGIVNVLGYGIDNYWSFLNMHPRGFERGDSEHMTIRYGFSTPEITSFNPLYATEEREWKILGLIYDTLLKRNPDNHSELMPWLASDYKVDTYCHPVFGWCSKVKFTLRPDMYWADGTPLTTADVYFTFVELDEILISRGYPPPWWYPNVEPILSFQICDAYNFEVLFNCKSIYAADWIDDQTDLGYFKWPSGCVVLPKHIWKPIAETGDPEGFAPDPNMIGSGPWRFVEYTGYSHILMVANKPGSTVTTSFPGSEPIPSPYGYWRYSPIIGELTVDGTLDRKIDYYTQPHTINFTATNEWYGGPITIDLSIKMTFANGTIFEDTVTDIVLAAKGIPGYSYSYTRRDVMKGNVKIDFTIEIKDPTELAGGDVFSVSTILWSTIKEDIAGSTFYDDIGSPDYPYKMQLPTPDFKVDIRDVAFAARAFGSYPGHMKWSTVADINCDYKIDIKDIAAIARMFGWIKK